MAHLSNKYSTNSRTTIVYNKYCRPKVSPITKTDNVDSNGEELDKVGYLASRDSATPLVQPNPSYEKVIPIK